MGTPIFPTIGGAFPIMQFFGEGSHLTLTIQTGVYVEGSLRSLNPDPVTLEARGGVVHIIAPP